MVLTRESLQNGLMRDLWHSSGQNHRVLTDAELDASVDAMLATFGPGDPWVFGYGSLIWNPLLHFIDREAATLHGYHRRFCLWSRTGRGLPERPGLVLGLDRGGCCRGVGFRIERSVVREELRLLWRREMLAAAYTPRWITVRVGGEDVKAVAFIINRKHSNYAGRLTIDQTVQALATGIGSLGSSREYFLHTIDGLRQHGVDDPHLIHLRERVLGHEVAPQSDPADQCL
ncbi:MAG: gamma-glutamylcyclotransferase [Betaproteobacteria bacterium]|nr:gamma-glutamylcyclotransferase [Betaproteobacteria bacterium]